MDTWNSFWTWANENQLAATVIGGAILLGALKLLSFIPKIGPHIGKFLNWTWSFHPVSARRHSREVKALRGEMNDVAEDVVRRLKLESDDFDRSTAADRKIYADALGRAEQVHGAAAIGASKPLPEPRWAVRLQPGTSDQFQLVNTVPRSVAREVRIETDTNLTIMDAGHWEDLSGIATGPFIGELSSSAYSQGVNMSVTWHDEALQRKTVKVSLTKDGIERSAPF